MARTYKGKVATIGRQYPADLKALRDGNDGRIDKSDPRILVSTEKLQTTPKILERKLLDSYFSAYNRPHQFLFGLCPQMDREKIGGFRQNRDGDHERITRTFKEPDNAMVPIVISIGRCVERTRIDQNWRH